MSERHMSPDELDEIAKLDEEQAFINSTSRQYRRVKIEKGDEWTVRFLPMEFGPKKWFYQRIAFHWIAKRPIYCHRNTAIECGGDPDFQCLLCSEAERLNGSKNSKVATAGMRAFANPQYLVYCCVFEKFAKGDSDVYKGKEKWKAWEFPMTKWTFADFIALYRRSLKRKPDKGFMNLVNGNDIVISFPGRNMQFEPLETQAIAETSDPEKFQKTIETIWASVQMPNFREPSEEDMEKAVEKLNESARFGGGTSTSSDRSSSRRRSSEDDFQDEDPPDDRPRRRAADEPEAETDDQPRRRHVEAESETEDRPRRRSAEDEPANEDDEPRRSTPVAPKISAKSAVTPSSMASARSAPPPSRSAPPPPARASAAPPPPAAKAAPKIGPAQSSIEDEDNVADEDRDPAPPIEAPQDEAVEVADDAPPAVEAPVTSAPKAPVPDLKSRLSRGIAAAKERQ
jgi:hypothetical protein